MKAISPFLRPLQKDSDVANLQEGLLLLLRQQILKLPREQWLQLQEGVTQEQAQQVYNYYTKATVTAFQKQFGLPVSGEVYESTANAINKTLREFVVFEESEAKSYSVEGDIRLESGEAIAATTTSTLTIRAYDQGLRDRKLLGETKPNEAGHYKITYSRKEFLEPERLKAHLVMEAIAANGKILTTTPVRFNAPEKEVVNLAIAPQTPDVPKTELEWLERQLLPKLKTTRPAILSKADLEYLAKTSRIQLEPLNTYAEAAKLADQSQYPLVFHYALLRKGVSATPEQLLEQPISNLQKTFVAAQEEGLIPRQSEETTQKLWQQIETLQLDHQLTKPLTGRPSSLKQLLDVAKIPAADQRTLGKTLLSHPFLNAGVWQQIRQQSPLDASLIDKAERVVQIGTLINDHLATLEEVQQDNRIHSIRDLAKHYDLDTWKAVVAKSVSENDATLPGQTLTEKRETFAKEIYTKVVEAYPTVAVSYSLSKHPVLSRQRVAQLLPTIVEQDETFNLAQRHLEAYIHSHASTLNISEADKPHVIEQLQQVQRVYRLKPDVQAIAHLLENQLDSSAAIVRQGRTAFLANLGKDTVLGHITAREIYARAEVTVAQAFMLYTHFSPTFNQSYLAPFATQESPEQLQQIPNFKNLFGSLDTCACEPCQSVYSPAAYLTDLLAFLQEARTNAGSINALEALKFRVVDDSQHNLIVSNQARRSDLLDIKLSCRNADTSMPYVDLVLEILEQAIAPTSSSPLQTTLTAEELAASPEHLNDRAYEILAQAIFPFSLPFDRWFTEGNVYLEKLETSRAEWLELFFVPSQNSHDLPEIQRWQDVTIARAHLRLNAKQWDLIANQTQDPLLPTAWGYSYRDVEWQKLLATASTFLKKTSLEYHDLLWLLNLKAVNESRTLNYYLTDPNSCDPDTIIITGLNREALSFLHRFLRLYHMLGWSMRELDRAVVSLSDPNNERRPDLNERLLTRLSHVKQLQAKFNLPLVELLSWWSPIDTADYNDTDKNLPPSHSLYESLFLVGRHNEPTYDAFKLNVERDELQNPNLNLSDYLAVISSALRLSQPDLDQLIAGVFGQASSKKLILRNLSKLYRHQSLARALKLNIKDYLTLKTLIKFPPFGFVLRMPADFNIDVTTQTLRFIDRVEQLRASSFSIAEADYILRQTYPSTGNVLMPTEEWVIESLKKLQKDLLPLESLPPVSDGDNFVRKAQEILSKVIPGDKVQLFFDILDVDSLIVSSDLSQNSENSIKKFSVDEIQNFKNTIDHAYLPLLTSKSEAEKQENQAKLEVLKKQLCSESETERDSNLQHRYWLAAQIPLTAFNREQLTKNHEPLARNLSDQLGLPVQVCAVLLGNIVSQKTDPTTTAGEAFLSEFQAFASSSTNNSSPALLEQKLGAVLILFHKISVLVSKLQITADELLHLKTYAPTVGWLDLNSLPVREGDAMASCEGLLRLINLYQFRNELPAHQQSHLLELFTKSERRDYTQCLSQLTNWDQADLDLLIRSNMSNDDGGMLKTQFPDHFRDERLLIRVANNMQWLRNLGVSALKVKEWSASTLLFTQQVGRIRNVVAAKYGESWLSVAKQLRDPLREAQRLALVAYLTHTWNLQRPDDLFDRFLIDVEMSPCQMTSRIIQAISSVQLFVQRILMGLEPGVAMSEEAADQWDWMENYRVWEANRKVFLYPENWIDPTLRDDKTPFFKDLENELMQNEITNETAETALLHYLEKLHEVARLQICGAYKDEETGTLHVFARTRDIPHSYYYRQQLDGLHWTAWEKIDVDVEGDHLIPMVYNRRLYLFWPIFTEKDEPPLSQLEQQIIEIIRFPIILQLHFTQLRNDVVLLVKSVGESAISTTADLLNQQLEPIKTGLNLFISELNKIINQFNTKLKSGTSIKLDLDVIKDSNKSSVTKNAFLGDAVDAFVDAGKDAVGGATGNAKNAFEGTQPPWEKLENMIQALPSLNTIKEAVENLLNQMEGTSSIGIDLNLDQLSQITPIRPNVPPIPSDIQAILQQINDHLQALNTEINKFLTGQVLKLLPAKRLEIQLAWSEYKNDRWSAKKTSIGLISFRDVVSSLFEIVPAIPGFGKLNCKHLFTFKGELNSNNELFIHGDISVPIVDMTNWPTEWFRYVPLEIGYFKLNDYSGKIEASDIAENPTSTDLINYLASQINDLIQEGYQQFQPGEPTTPDDDPNRPSLLRQYLKDLPLPKRYFPLNSQDEREDIYRILALHQYQMPAINDPQQKTEQESTSNLIRRLIKALPKLTKLFFYQDSVRSFIYSGEQGQNFVVSDKQNYSLQLFYHPYAHEFLKTLNRFGISGIYSIKSQNGQPLQSLRNMSLFQKDSPNSEYRFIERILEPYPIEDIDFNDGAYSQYNWELFFHIPFLIACRLSTRQKFKEAQQWFHYIFNPTDTSLGAIPSKYWRTRPFVETSQEDYQRSQASALLQGIAEEGQQAEQQNLETAIESWKDNAFNPYLVARTRTTAFQKAVVMKYIDNLIAWGDSLFRQETREAVNEATQLYILAAKLLGDRPQSIPKRRQIGELSYRELPPLDDFSNALIKLENYVLISQYVGQYNAGSIRPFITQDRRGHLDRVSLAPTNTAWGAIISSQTMRSLLPSSSESTLYFCAPLNQDLLKYWDTVGDRLFKIRHCLNIEGKALSLPLLAPPIDPAILVRARAAGVDINTILSEFHAPLPHYRFNALTQKVAELCNDLKSLGSALLSALEKRDGEALSVLRNTQELAVLEAVQTIKKHQIKESQAALEGLRKSQESTFLRLAHYQRLLLEFINPEETIHAALSATSLIMNMIQMASKTGSVAASLIPNIKGGFPTTIGATFGGGNTGDAASRASDAIGQLSSMMSSAGSLILTMGGYRRRAEDWGLQIVLATKELENLDRQIAAAEIRVAIAEQDLENQKIQIQNNKEVNDFMRQKFTNQDLYEWMISEISAIYFQTYQLAYDLAKKCERTFQFELGTETTNFIQYGYWDNLRKGLLAGEHLHHAIKRMEIAYLEQNKREYELTKPISLLLHDPLALITLKETGQCEFELPEMLFDADYCGHYMRRIKSISLTIPALVAPYTNINCTLTLLTNEIRVKSIPGDPYPRDKTNNNDDRFQVYAAATQSIATSTAQNDSGLFELNFRDERYLPFEGAGVISTWKIEMPKDCNAFDFDEISDVVFKLNYTAREGGEVLRKTAKQAKQDVMKKAATSPLARLFSAKHEFSTEWQQFLYPKPTESSQILNLPINPQRFPFQILGKTVTITEVEVFLKFKDIQDDRYTQKTPLGDYSAGTSKLGLYLVLPSGSNPQGPQFLTSDPRFPGIPHAVFENISIKASDRWSIEARDAEIGNLAGTLQTSVNGHHRLKAEAIEDLILVCHYSVSSS